MSTIVLPARRRPPALRSAPTLALVVTLLAGCAQDDPTEPGTGGPPTPAPSPIAELATAKTNIWATKAPMPTARTLVTTAVVNDVVYAIGGASATGVALATVQAYNPAANTWSTKASLPQPRAGLAAGTINGTLYVAGGTDPTETPATGMDAFVVQALVDRL